MKVIKENNEPLTWHNSTRKLGDLIAYEHNPRTLTQKERRELKASLQKFDLAEVPAVNLDNKIVAGHQRVSILLEIYGRDYIIDVREPSRMLTPTEFDEYLVRSNKNGGKFDFDILANRFDEEALLSWGFTEKELGLEGFETDFDEVPDPDLDGREKDTFEVIVECTSAEDQAATLDFLKKGGYKCRALTL